MYAFPTTTAGHVPPPHELLRDAAEAAKSMRRIRLYSRMTVQDFKDRAYRKRVRPSELHTRAEDIYDDNLTLKSKVHQLE